MTIDRRQQGREPQFTDAGAWAQKSEGFVSTSVKLPENGKFFTLKKIGFYKIDIIPYVVGKGNPNADEGFVHFERTYHAHRGLGVDGKSSYVCPTTFGSKCPVCEWILRHGAHGDKKTVDRLKKQLRHLWCVIDRDDIDKGIQVWDTAHFKSFGELLKNKLKAVSAYSNFWRLDERGYTLQLSVGQGDISGNKFYQVSNIEMLPRDYRYQPDLYNEAPCLDELLLPISYDELKKIFDMEEVPGAVAGAVAAPESRNGPRTETLPAPRAEAPRPERPAPERPATATPPADAGVRVGDTVSFTHEGRKVSGKVRKVSGGAVTVLCDDIDEPVTVQAAALEPARWDVGDSVEHPVHGVCTVVRVGRDGATVMLEDQESDLHSGVPMKEVYPVGKAPRR